jgi:hypothetical protein
MNVNSQTLMNLRDRIDNQANLIDHLRDEIARLREENEEFRRKLIAFTGVDPR